MIVRDTPFAGLHVIDLLPQGDDRGSFTRVYCRDTLVRHGLEPVGDQWSLSQNHRAGTLRGMHYQAPPQMEIKLIRCVAGAVFDAVVDLRRDQPTYGRAFSIALSAAQPTMLYVPRGFAHGFLTLEDNSELLYAISPSYASDAARGIRWNDPELAIPWPHAPTVVSERDSSLPLLCDAGF